MTCECRRGVRIPYTTAVELNTAFGQVKCTTRDISSGGMFVDAKTPLSIGQRFELNFRFRSGGHSIKLMAQVIRETRQGFGIKLL